MYTLLVIDMQPGFLKRFDEYQNTLAKDEVIAGCREKVQQAIADGAQIIDVNYTDNFGPLGATIPEIADLWKGYKKLFKRRVSKVMKSGDGGGAEIHPHLQEEQIRVCGINAGACVRDTVWQLSERCIDNEHIRVYADAVANAWNYDCEGDLAYMNDFACTTVE